MSNDERRRQRLPLSFDILPSSFLRHWWGIRLNSSFHEHPMARRLAVWLIALSLAGAAGCRSRSDLVEAELRTKDRQLRETQGELMRAETMNEALEYTLRDQRAAGLPVCRPGAGPLGLVKDIQLGRGTGGIDEDK